MTAGSSRRRGVIRLDLTSLQSPVLSAVTDAEFRVLMQLWAWFARHGESGEVPVEQLLGAFAYMVKGGRFRRLTPAQVTRFVSLGLLVALRDAEGAAWVRAAHWR